MSEGGSWKGLLCSFIGSTITNIPSVNLGVQPNANDDAELSNWSRSFLKLCIYLFSVDCICKCVCGVFPEVFTCVHLDSLRS